MGSWWSEPIAPTPALATSIQAKFDAIRHHLGEPVFPLGDDVYEATDQTPPTEQWKLLWPAFAGVNTMATATVQRIAQTVQPYGTLTEHVFTMPVDFLDHADGYAHFTLHLQSGIATLMKHRDRAEPVVSLSLPDDFVHVTIRVP